MTSSPHQPDHLGPDSIGSPGASENLDTDRPLIRPAIDIHQNDEGLVLKADLPGVPRENVELSVENNVLKLFGRARPIEGHEGQPVALEYRVGDFYRSFILSEEVDTERIRAEMASGVLTLFLPFPQESRSRRIDVQPGEEPAAPDDDTPTTTIDV